MPKHITIEGGQLIGAPKNWDAAKHGPCEALHAVIEEQDGIRSFTSAYRMAKAEQDALASGGALFLRILAERHPVISMWVQPADRAEVVGDGLQFDQDGKPVEPATRAAQASIVDIGFAAMMEELELQAEQRSNQPDIGDADEVGQVWMKGTFGLRAALEVAIEAIGEAQTAIRAPSMVEVPVMTLEAVAAEHQAREAIEKATRPYLGPHGDEEQAKGDE